MFISKLTFFFFTDGLYWHPQNENPIVIKKDPIVDLDKYLSCYLNQFNAGAIEVQDDPKLPTFMHFAVKHEMKELIKTLLNLPGGTQMSTMVNNDGLNARDLAVQNGNEIILSGGRDAGETVAFKTVSKLNMFWKVDIGIENFT